MAHVRQSRPDSGLGFPGKVLKTLQVVPLSLSPPSRVSILALRAPKGAKGYYLHKVDAFA